MSFSKVSRHTSYVKKRQMRKVLISILVLATIFCSGGFAQSGPNSFSIALDPKLKDVRTLSCGEEGFCIYTEKRTRKIHQITLTHCDTLLQKQWDTTMVLPDEWKQHQIFYENGVHCGVEVVDDQLFVFFQLLFRHHAESRLFARDGDPVGDFFLQGDRKTVRALRVAARTE